MVTVGLITALGACASADGDGDSASSEDDLSSGTPLRIDVAGLECHGGGNACPASFEKCECMAEFEALNYAKPHLLAVSSNLLTDRIHARGNFIVAYYDTLNDGFDAGKTGTAAASDLLTQLGTQFGGSVPKYIVLNEISKECWTSRDPKYRSYVLSFVKELGKVHKKVPIICAPFGLPAKYTDGSDWAELARAAYVAAEIQVSGADVKAARFSVDAVRKQYRDSIESYAQVGVPKTRLLVLDNFSQTPAKTTFGRDGVSEDDWRRAIQVRAAALAPLDAAGYVSYGWAGNKMHATSAKRIEWERVYAAQTLP